MSAHHGTKVHRYVPDVGATETTLLLHGPSGTQPFSDVHLGAFKVAPSPNPSGSRTISMQMQITATEPCWVRLSARWYSVTEGGVLNAAGEEALIPDLVLDGDQTRWTEIEIFRTVPAPEISHWRPFLRLYGTDPKIDGLPLAAPAEVWLDCLYVPDNGRSLEGQEYIDGDQPGYIWEGDPHDSSSVLAPVVVEPPDTTPVM